MSAILRSLGAVCSLALLSAPVPAGAQDISGVSIMEPGETSVSQTIRLGLNKSTVIELDRPVADVVITNPSIADAVVQTAQRLIFRGIEVGETNAFLFDRHGRPILNLEIVVNADTAALERLVLQGLTPDRTLLFDVPVAEGLARAGKRSRPDRIEREQAAFFERVRQCYLERATGEPDRFRVVDAGVGLDQVRAQLENHLQEMLQWR